MRAVERVLVLGRLHVRLEHEERHRQEDDDDGDVAVPFEGGGHSGRSYVVAVERPALRRS